MTGTERGREERRGGEAEARGEAKLQTTAPSDGARKAETIPWWKVEDTPMGSHQESVNRRRKRTKRERERGGTWKV